ncbi:MAG: hybrid sensor histidine kinase/response regulator [Actinomycetota bacterium]
MKVLLCDTADEVTRLQHALRTLDPLAEIEVTTDSDRVIEMAAGIQPDVVATELGLEGLKDVHLVRRLRDAAPLSAVVGWTRLRDPGRVAQVLAAGASGYLLKEDGVEEAARAIQAAAAGSVVLTRSAATLLGADLGNALARVRELEEKIRDLQTQMEEGTTAKGDFLANVSHELRTPVTVAKGIAYVLRNPHVSEEERGEFIEQLQTSLDKLAGLVDEIIEISELEQGTFQMNIAYIDLAPLIDQAVVDMGLRHPSVLVLSRIPGTLFALADGQRIHGVIHELLENACRYSPEDRAVEIRARVMDQGIVISVLDQGIGMDREVAWRSFEQPFSTGEATLRKEKAGAGVGLHLSRQLVIRHGGILWTDPVPAGGTRVSFCLPSKAGATFVAPPGAA